MPSIAANGDGQCMTLKSLQGTKVFRAFFVCFECKASVISWLLNITGLFPSEIAFCAAPIYGVITGLKYIYPVKHYLVRELVSSLHLKTKATETFNAALRSVGSTKQA